MLLKILILPAAFLANWVFIETFLSKSDSDWRLSFLLTFVFTNGYLILLTEFLNIFAWVSSWGIFLGWAALILFLGSFYLCKRKKRKLRFPAFDFKGLSFWDWALIALIIIVLISVALVAFLSRPATADVLNYHLPRVAHWIQNHSVNHFASGIEIQNRYPPAAEYQVLHVFALTGNDLLVKFPAWTMLLVSIISGSLFASKLGISRSGSLLTALFIATLPNAIMQASSVKNDLHVAGLTLLLAALMLTFLKGERSLAVMAAIALTFSLGYLTKSTTILFMAPLIVWFGIRSLKQFGLRSVISWVFLAIVVFLLINGGFFLRNMKTFGSFQDVSASSRLINDEFTLKGTFSNLLRNLGFHLQYPWEQIRDGIELFIIKVHVKLGLDINEPSYTSDGYFAIKSPNTSSVQSGNTLHAHLLLLSVIVTIYLLIKHKLDPALWLPILLGGAGYLIFCTVIKWQVFGARYSLAVFFLMAPLFGSMVSKIPFKWTGLACGIALVVLTYPWLLSVRDRPLLPIRPYSSSPSLFLVNRFDYEPESSSLRALRRLVEEDQCDQIGLFGTGTMTEYDIWAALEAPRSDIRLEWLVAGTPSARYVDKSFDPCLIVCAKCSSDLGEIHGLVPVFTDSAYVIYGPKE